MERKKTVVFVDSWSTSVCPLGVPLRSQPNPSLADMADHVEDASAEPTDADASHASAYPPSTSLSSSQVKKRKNTIDSKTLQSLTNYAKRIQSEKNTDFSLESIRGMWIVSFDSKTYTADDFLPAAGTPVEECIESVLHKTGPSSTAVLALVANAQHIRVAGIGSCRLVRTGQMEVEQLVRDTAKKIIYVGVKIAMFKDHDTFHRMKFSPSTGSPFAMQKDEKPPSAASRGARAKRRGEGAPRALKKQRVSHADDDHDITISSLKGKRGRKPKKQDAQPDADDAQPDADDAQPDADDAQPDADDAQPDADDAQPDADDAQPDADDVQPDEESVEEKHPEPVPRKNTLVSFVLPSKQTSSHAKPHASESRGTAQVVATKKTPSLPVAKKATGESVVEPSTTSTESLTTSSTPAAAGAPSATAAKKTPVVAKKAPVAAAEAAAETPAKKVPAAGGAAPAEAPAKKVPAAGGAAAAEAPAKKVPVAAGGAAAAQAPAKKVPAAGGAEAAEAPTKKVPAAGGVEAAEAPAKKVQTATGGAEVAGAPAKKVPVAAGGAAAAQAPAKKVPAAGGAEAAEAPTKKVPTASGAAAAEAPAKKVPAATGGAEAAGAPAKKVPAAGGAAAGAAAGGAKKIVVPARAVDSAAVKKPATGAGAESASKPVVRRVSVPPLEESSA